MIDILSITSEKLKKGEYKKSFPEYYSLKSVKENNAWHDNQVVFDHVVAVFAGLEEALKLNFLKKRSGNIIKKHLKKIIGKRSKEELLIISTLLHDIAKKDTVIKDKMGRANTPGHEIIGSVLVKKFSRRFGLNKKDKDYVKRIVHFHGFISDILSLIIARGNYLKYFNLFEQVVGDIGIELALLMYADILGSDLDKSDPSGAKERLFILTKFLNG